MPAPGAGTAAAGVAAANATTLLDALGGRANVSRLELGGDRLLLQLLHPQVVDTGALPGLGVRAVDRLQDGAWQLLLGPAAVPAHAALRAAMEA